MLIKEKEMSKFKVGDKVVRTEPYTWNDDGGFMQVGREYYVVESSEEVLVIKGDFNNIQYDPDMFALVQTAFKNMKFRVNSPEQSKEIQEALFEMGFCWRSYGCEVRFTDSFPPCDYLYTDTAGYLWRIDSENDSFVSSFKSAQEYTIETTKSYKLIPVEIVKETLTIDGKTYDKEAVLKRLAELETLEVK